MRKYFKNIYLGFSTIWLGMMVTIKHLLFYKNITIQYPEQKLQLPERERNRLYVNIDDCIGCDQCVRACPVNCIEIETIKAVPGDKVGKTGVTSGDKKKALFVPKFIIDFAKCCYCELCVFPCPTECIYMTEVFEFSELQRNDLVYEFTDLTPEQADEKRQKAEEWAVEMQKKKEAKAKEAAAKKVPEKKAPLNSTENDNNNIDKNSDIKSDDKPSKES
jgi:NADH-quinone oxidoreductase subunit I